MRILFFLLVVVAAFASTAFAVMSPTGRRQRDQEKAKSILRHIISELTLTAQHDGNHSKRGLLLLQDLKSKMTNHEQILQLLKDHAKVIQKKEKTKKATKKESSSSSSSSRLIDRIDTRIGSGGSGWGQGSMTSGPTLPNSPFRFNPQTSLCLDGLGLRIPFQSESGYSCAGRNPPSGGFFGEYIFDDTCMAGAAITSVVGAGEADWQNFLTTVVRLADSSAPVPPSLVVNGGYKSKFRHETETASPGYYSVLLDTWNVKMELAAAGTLAGISRFTCLPTSNNQDCALVLDVCHGAPRPSHIFDYGASCQSAQILSYTQSSSKITITATMRDAGNFLDSAPGGALPIWAYFEITPLRSNATSSAAATFGEMTFFQNGQPAANATAVTTSGKSSVVIPLPGSGTAAGSVGFEVRSSLSFISADYAKSNFAAQQLATFEYSVARTQQIWEQYLGQFSVHVDNTSAQYDENVWSFTNGAYTSGIPPTIYNEWDGSYVGLDQQVYKPRNPDSGMVRVSDLSLWDIYRANTPFLFFSNRNMHKSLVKSMVQMVRERNQKGYSPKWVMASVETDVMVGLHGCTIMMDWIQKLNATTRSTDPLVRAAFEHCVSAVRDQNRKMMPTNGPFGPYTPTGGYGRGAGGTLEYSINAAAVMNAARLLDNFSVVLEMAPYSNATMNIWNSSRGMFCDRQADGTWECPPTDTDAWMPHPWVVGDFVESCSMLYRFYQPAYLHQLTAQFGGLSNFAEALYLLFMMDPLWTHHLPFNSTLPSPLFLGNEPAMLVPFQALLAGGAPSQTGPAAIEANKIAWISNHFQAYLLGSYFPNGWTSVNGNFDYGALQWCAIGMQIGFYPVVPGDPVTGQSFYVLMAPVFRRTELRLPGSGGAVTLRLLADPATCKIGDMFGVKNYLANATVNGAWLQRPVVSHDQLVAAPVPTIVFYCAQQPVTFASNEPPYVMKQTDEQYTAQAQKIIDGIVLQLLKKL